MPSDGSLSENGAHWRIVFLIACAVGFPYSFSGSSIPQSSQRFAGLMRMLCERNGGTFVALTMKDR